MDGFTKRILRIPIEKPFDEVYFSHRLWMFFRETKVTEDDIRKMFHQVIKNMRHMITLSKKSDPGKFAIPCVVKDIKLNWNSSLLLGRSFLATAGAVCDMNKNKLCLTLIDPNIHYDPIRPKRKIINSHESEYETEYSESIDTHTFPSIDSNESTVTDDRNNTLLYVDQPVDHFALPNHCYPHFAFQPPSKRGRDDYSIGSWADTGFHESFAVDTLITSPNEEHTEEYDEDYWKEYTNTFPTLFDEVHSTSVDIHPRPAKQPLTSIDTHTGTSIDIRAAAKIQEQENIPSPTRFIDTYLKRFAPLKPPPHTRADTQAEKDEHSSVYINRKIHEEHSSQQHKAPDGNARAIDGRILQVSIEDIADILQVANGPDNLFSQQRGTPYVIQTDPNKHVGVAATKINPDLSCQPKGQASIDGTAQTSIDMITPTSTDKDDLTSIDKRYEFGYRAFDMYGARKFTWEQRDEYGVYRYECGHARGVAGEMIHVTKDDIRKLLERTSLFEESHICLPEQATSFTFTRLAPELYTKDEINEMVIGICGAQENLGEELKSLVEDTHQPLDRGYNKLFRSMVEMRTKIESLRQQLEKEATTSASIDAPHAPSIDVSLLTAQIPAEPQYSAEHKDEWEVSYINTRINDVYYPLNNNVEWLNTKIELLQQDLDTIRKKDQQPATSIDVCTITSLDAKISTMNDRLQTYEDMHDRFISPANSFSIDRLRGPWIDGKNLVELLPYTAAEVDKITSKIYTAIATMEERLDKRCDDINFPFDNRIGGLDSHAEWLHKEVKAIKRQLAAQHQISESIDRKRAQSLDGKSPRSTDEHNRIDRRRLYTSRRAADTQKDRAGTRSALTTFKIGYRTSPMYLRRWMTNGQEMMRPQEEDLNIDRRRDVDIARHRQTHDDRCNIFTSIDI
ncbi:hypothetical protein IGI04_002106 [Brassica rapa subsp. trilocularis]|uniref:Uncharacterized protein n=1 Tax=Brassica rapa subsp. trilocularis TaxID=1813537 RepID=A0ABQ7NXV2_BRACM|nr:hypothetical protein IGI04_002106 [Brassica rapa subsp. trilocularis]